MARTFSWRQAVVASLVLAHTSPAAAISPRQLSNDLIAQLQALLETLLAGVTPPGNNNAAVTTVSRNGTTFPTSLSRGLTTAFPTIPTRGGGNATASPTGTRFPTNTFSITIPTTTGRLTNGTFPGSGGNSTGNATITATTRRGRPTLTFSDDDTLSITRFTPTPSAFPGRGGDDDEDEEVDTNPGLGLGPGSGVDEDGDDIFQIGGDMEEFLENTFGIEIEDGIIVGGAQGKGESKGLSDQQLQDLVTEVLSGKGKGKGKGPGPTRTAAPVLVTPTPGPVEPELPTGPGGEIVPGVPSRPGGDVEPDVPVGGGSVVRRWRKAVQFAA